MVQYLLVFHASCPVYHRITEVQGGLLISTPSWYHDTTTGESSMNLLLAG